MKRSRESSSLNSSALRSTIHEIMPYIVIVIIGLWSHQNDQYSSSKFEARRLHVDELLEVLTDKNAEIILDRFKRSDWEQESKMLDYKFKQVYDRIRDLEDKVGN